MTAIYIYIYMYQSSAHTGREWSGPTTTINRATTTNLSRPVDTVQHSAVESKPLLAMIVAHVMRIK